MEPMSKPWKQLYDTISEERRGKIEGDVKRDLAVMDDADEAEQRRRHIRLLEDIIEACKRAERRTAEKHETDSTGK